MIENQISKEVLHASIKVHRTLGPGLLECSYEECLFFELRKRGLFVEKQKALPLIYEEQKLEVGYRIDLLVERKVIIEIKSVERLNDVHLAQLLTYLKLADLNLGLLINFNVVLLKHGYKRIINNSVNSVKIL